MSPLPAQGALVHPAWAQNQPIYSVNLEMFSAAGTYKALEARLPQIKALGAGMVWILPHYTRGVLKAFNSPYCVRDYRGFHAPYGTAQDFQDLVNACHAQGLKLIIDWVANHTAWDHPWITSNPAYYVRVGGVIQQAQGWTDVAQLDYTNAALRAAMISEMQYWVTAYNVDGFRCDVAWNVPDSFWDSARAALDAVKPVYMVAEDNSTTSATAFDSDYDWDLVNPVLHNVITDVAQGVSPATYIDSAMWLEPGYPAGFLKMRFTTNYDEWKDLGTPFTRLGGGVQAFAVLQGTLKGKPMIYNGQEIGWSTQTGPITWNSTSPFINFYTRLLTLHQNNPAMWAGTFAKLPSNIDSKVYCFMRQSGTAKVLVMLNLTNQSVPFTVNNVSLSGTYTELFTDAVTTLGNSYSATFAAWQYTVLVSGSPAATATPTFSSAVTATPSRTATSTQTLTASPSQTHTQSMTESPSFTASPGSTATRTPTPTATATPTQSPTSSQSPSSTATSSPSLTATPTLTVTQTQSRTAGPSVTPTLTATRTISPGSTPTWTLSSTVTPTRTSTPTGTFSPTATDSRTPTSSVTLSATPSMTFTVTRSNTPGNTPSFTISPTQSSSPSQTMTATPTGSPTQTETLTQTGTLAPTKTMTPSVTSTPISTGSPSPTPSASGTLSQSPGRTVTATLTRTSTVTAIPTIQATAVPENNGDVLICLPSQNPQSGPGLKVSVLLSGPMGSLKFRIYSQAMTAMLDMDLPGQRHAGWNSLRLDIPGLGNGLYYVKAGNAPAAKVMVLQ